MDKIFTKIQSEFIDCNSSSPASEADDINDDSVPSSPEEETVIRVPQTAFEETADFSIYGKQEKLITIQDVPYSEPSEYEIKMLEGTIKPDILLKQEEEELEKQEDEEALQLRQRHQYITMVKVLALVKANKQPLDNPSVFNKVDKLIIINNMDEIMNTMSPDEIKEEFHKICNEKIFTPHADYSTFAITCGK
jgi:hypothetical protein